jgi:hypothetical protein
MFEVDQASLLQPDYTYPLLLGVDARLIVFFHAAVDAPSASYAARQIEAIPPQNAGIGRLRTDMKLFSEFPPIFFFESGNKSFLLLIRHLAETLLQELLYIHLGAGQAS